MKRCKTYKREVATLQLVLHWGLVMGILYLAITNNDRDLDALVDLAIGLAIWVYGFAAAAFGMDSWVRQLEPARNGRATTRTETTVTQPVAPVTQPEMPFDE